MPLESDSRGVRRCELHCCRARALPGTCTTVDAVKLLVWALQCSQSGDVSSRDSFLAASKAIVLCCAWAAQCAAAGRSAYLHSPIRHKPHRNSTARQRLHAAPLGTCCISAHGRFACGSHWLLFERPRHVSVVHTCAARKVQECGGAQCSLGSLSTCTQTTVNLSLCNRMSRIARPQRFAALYAAT